MAASKNAAAIDRATELVRRMRDDGRANSDLIALANPATMLALVEALRSARKGAL